MITGGQQEPWEQLEDILRQDNPQLLRTYLHSLSPGEVARALSRLDEERQQQLLTVLAPVEAADVLEELPEAQAADLLKTLPPERAAAILDRLPSDEQVDLLGGMDTEEATAILREMAPEEAADVRRLSQYPPDTAGGLMVTEYLAYPEYARVGDVLDDLRAHAERYATYDVQYAYITSQAGTLVGVLRLRDLLLSPPATPVSALMMTNPLRVQTSATLDTLREFFDRHAFFGVPVTDEAGRLVGVVRRADVEEAVGERADRTLLRVSGIISGEELRSMPLSVRSLRRLSWLSLNIPLNLLAASVIAVYEETLAAAITLAVFLPVISAVSGNAGIQAVAVSLRELALGLVQPYELARVLFKEAWVGVLNGALLGLLLGGLAWGWNGNPSLGLVAGGALALNTVVGVSLGGIIPLLLRRLNMDPALASGLILTTVTDMCGFFLALSLATVLLSQLAS
ncbi:MAG: magnesium transporter [Thermodesulfobacteriota bacterium]|jgi:magnesium transporter